MRKRYVLRRAVWKQDGCHHSAVMGMRSNIMFMLYVHQSSEEICWNVKEMFMGKHCRTIAYGKICSVENAKDKCENVVFCLLKKSFIDEVIDVDR